MKKGYTDHFVPQFKTLYESFCVQAEIYGDRNRFIYLRDGEEKTITFKDMKTRLDYAASAISKLGLTGKYSAVTGDNHPDYITTYMSVVTTGGVIVPLDKDIKDEQFCGFVDLCSIELMFYTDSMHEKILHNLESLKTVKKFVCIDYNEARGALTDPRFMTYDAFLEMGKLNYEAGDRPAENYVPDLDAVCTILFTSGTTGTSKGVMLSQRNIVCAALDSCRIMAVAPGDTFVSVLPMHHAYEFTCEQIAMPNVGGTAFINDSIKNVLRNINRFKPSTMVFVPLYVETIYKRIWGEIRKKGKEKTVRNAIKISNGLLKVGIDLRRKLFAEILNSLGGNINAIVCGGATLRPELIKDFKSFGINIYEGYGITECSPLVSANPMHWQKARSVGLVVPHAEVKIDKTEEEETGEILVRGDIVMKGYFRNPEATAEAFTEDGWFRTGDIGYIDDDNFIFITGRKKNVIILSNGKNVFPEELEEYLGNSDLVSECAVVGRKNESGEAVITALLYPDYSRFEGKTEEEIREEMGKVVEKVNKELPTFKHIQSFEVRKEEFEKNTSRKIIRYKLK